ncbi:MAG: cupin domain-containing protein [Phycisphaerae bacterium]|nr:cupin domain-containing protein [Phycisphaerae bacterium]NIP50504.1 cupin domain-containing protein [Phycisphaerae bacterium]NIX26190.1 cupin domain-containing protein [Phycisphaerae bacterium]
MTTPVNKNNAEHYTWGQQCDGWHLFKSEGLSVIQERVPPGGAEVTHYHDRAQQVFFVITGAATLEVDGTIHRLSPGDSCHVPAGMTHQLRNEGDSDLEFLVVSEPMAHGDRVLVKT